MICWREVAGSNSVADPNGLVIGPVYFRQSPSAPFVRVLWDMRVSDYFVPYHDNSNRFYDLSVYNFTLTGLTAADCPLSFGVLLSTHVCKEVRDRGLMWKDFSGARRGEELVLWGALYAANYRYLQEYTFRDDGVIIGRQGATGLNYPTSETIAHAHNALWRIDIDLGGTTNNAARLQHFELPPNDGTAIDTNTAIAVAQGFTWSPRTHDAVQITNPSLKNAQGHDSAYQLVPLVTGEGLTQHVEPFTQNDLWVTPYNPAQFAARKLPDYVAGSPSVANRDLVVWYKGSDHHHPRDEDGVFGPNGLWTGTAHVMWAGFMLIPHDFFDCSPFYKPCP
jgi:Cu2+-containing amine oxidase